jgi:hypothetical protein
VAFIFRTSKEERKKESRASLSPSTRKKLGATQKTRRKNRRYRTLPEITILVQPAVFAVFPHIAQMVSRAVFQTSCQDAGKEENFTQNCETALFSDILVSFPASWLPFPASWFPFGHTKMLKIT